MLASRAALREGARAAASARVAVLPSAVRHCLRGGWPLTAGAAAPAATACGAVYSTLSAPTGCSSLLKVAHAPRRAAPAPTRDGTRSPCRRRTTTTTTTAAAAASPASAAYPHLERGHELVLDFATLADQHQYLAAGEKAAAAVRVAGRVTAKRQMGTKLAFYDVQSAGKVLQLLSRNTTFRRGDIIEASGVPGRTKTGEFSVFALGDADQCKLLASCLSNIPEALTDPELRHRLRHLELLVNPDLHRALRTRAKAISFLRGFLDARGFLEVETPVLCSQAGGAAAEPFATHSRALDADLVLRIAPELRLKELVIGGIDRVYEIGKQFRNEGVDTTHNPEFTTCEFYQAYADFEQLVATTEELVSGMVEACVGGHELGSPHGHTLNFTPPFRRISIADELRKALGRDLPLADDEQESVRLLLEALEERRLDTGGPHTLTVLLDRLISAIVEPRCTQPTFLVDHPLAMSPLAKQHKTMPDLASRFELFVDGREICNAYVELNDPAEQRRRFHQQLQDRAAGDKEAALPDEAFCSALEFGLPPTVGWGMGIDRMVMLLSGATSIRDVIAFPMLRPKSGDRSSRGLADLD